MTEEIKAKCRMRFYCMTNAGYFIDFFFDSLCHNYNKNISIQKYNVLS